MAVRVKTFQSELELVQWMTTYGVGIGSLVGPAVNASGQTYVIYEDDSDPTLIPDRVSPAGFSLAVASGAGDFVLSAAKTAVAAESVGAVPADKNVTATLANAAGNYLLPGTVSIAGPTPLQDDGSGNIVTVGSVQKRGTVNYSTHQLDFTYQLRDTLPTGNVLVDYEYSALPDSSNPPQQCFINAVSVTGAAADITFTIWNDEAKTVPVSSGTIPVAGGSGAFVFTNDIVSVVAERDLAKRNLRWVTVDGACTFFMHWRRF